MTNADKFKHFFGIYATELWAMPENDFLEWLNADAQDMPTVERKTGKWIWEIWSKYQCSKCGHVTDVDECMEEPMYNYCPYCGADMRCEDDDIPIEYFESGGK